MKQEYFCGKYGVCRILHILPQKDILYSRRSSFVCFQEENIFPIYTFLAWILINGCNKVNFYRLSGFSRSWCCSRSFLGGCYRGRLRWCYSSRCRRADGSWFLKFYMIRPRMTSNDLWIFKCFLQRPRDQSLMTAWRRDEITC